MRRSAPLIGAATVLVALACTAPSAPAAAHAIPVKVTCSPLDLPNAPQDVCRTATATLRVTVKIPAEHRRFGLAEASGPFDATGSVVLVATVPARVRRAIRAAAARRHRTLAVVSVRVASGSSGTERTRTIELGA